MRQVIQARRRVIQFRVKVELWMQEDLNWERRNWIVGGTCKFFMSVQWIKPLSSYYIG